MIQPLPIANNIFPTNLIQGPLAGISCAPFRKMVWDLSRPAFCYTEMISCKTLIYQPQYAYQRLVAKDPQEGPVCFQLSSENPGELGEATKIVTDCGADLIDLNCGCPVKKIRKKGAGSKLLSDASKLFLLISAMKNNTHLPISIKIRVDAKKDEFNKLIVQVLKDAGADFVTVHGRHWTEHYETACRYDEIQFFVDELSIPVIGNGDVKCLNSLKQMHSTGCAGVMVSRALVGQPWLIKQLESEFFSKPFIFPTKKEIGALFLKHVNQLADLLKSEKFALLQARQFAKYYAKLFSFREPFTTAVNSCEDLVNLKKVCDFYFKD